MTANAASNTPPNIKIKVVTICSPASIRKRSLVGVSAGNLLTEDDAQLAVNFAKAAERQRTPPQQEAMER